MRRKLTLDIVKDEFAKRNYELIESSYIDVGTNMKYICLKHPEEIQYASYNSFRRSKNNCKKCIAIAKAIKQSKYDIDFARKKFLEKGYVLLEDKYINKSIKMKYHCNKHPEYILNISLAELLLGRGCKYCGYETIRIKTRRSFDYVKQLFNDNNFILIDSEYKNGRTPMKCYCVNHPEIIQEKTTNSLQQGYGCYYCAIEQRTGSNSSCYKSDLADDVRIKRRDFPEYNHWRKQIFERDDYTCQCCGERGGKLSAHHKDGYHWCIERRVDIDNGVTLCEKCHVEFHSIYGIKNNTEEQYISFLQSKLINQSVCIGGDIYD